ncbi:MAG: branched-chain amino acid ABC transporter permease [Deltaproteobacteria bacterium]|nr:branched-chain amino acid ABC transporter permease [Deltaproteobacteria bacterium]
MVTSINQKKLLTYFGTALLLALAWFLPASGLLNPYVIQILMYVGINMILTLSLNLVNGYMGEFSVGHAGFMGIGAYVAAILTVAVLPRAASFWAFPAVLVTGGLAAAAAGLIVAYPSFRTRGDYLAIVTLAFNMIVKSVLENIDALGGPRGYLGMPRLTNLFWVTAWVLITLLALRNLVNSNFGRGIMAIREDEMAANLTSVDTRRLKLYAFLISAFFTGVAGGLYAHLLQFINPRSFSILKSTDMLVMVYLGGVGSLTGSLLGATIFTVLMELLRPLGLWRWVVGPLLLVLLMIFKPEGLMGFKEASWVKKARGWFGGRGVASSKM